MTKKDRPMGIGAALSQGALCLCAGAVLFMGAEAIAAPWRRVELPKKAASEMSAAELRATVEGLLAGYEPGDPGEALRRLGPPAADVLLALVQDPQVSVLRRLRAIEALGYVPTAAGLGYLRQLVAQRRYITEGLPVYEVAAAARALSGFGQAAGADLLALVDHHSADVREGVVSSLVRLRTPEAMTALRRRMVVERESGVRAALGAALR